MDLDTLSSYAKYRYETWDEGWGCGWRCLQMVSAKLLQREDSVERIYQTLLERGHCGFPKEGTERKHYGFLDASMIAAYYSDEHELSLEMHQIRTTNELTAFVSHLQTLQPFGYASVVVMIHDGYVVVIDDVRDEYVKIIDPHQPPNSGEKFIGLQTVGKGGIGWKNLREVVFYNSAIIGLETDPSLYLELNSPTFCVIRKRDTVRTCVVKGSCS